MVNEFIKFNPVQLTEKQLRNIGIENNITTNGSVFFTTDSQTIYMGMPDGKVLSMSGNTDVFYGKKEIEYPNDGKELDPIVIFSMIEDIEGERVPLINDLILNIDGCFYRITSIDEDETYITTERITLRGSGGGGGSTDGPVVSNFSVSIVGSKENYFAATTNSASISFKGNSADETNYIEHIWWVFEKNPEEIVDEIYGLEHPMQIPYTLNLLPYLSRFDETGNTIVVHMSDKYGTERELKYKIYRIELSLTTNEEQLIPVLTDNFQFNLNIDGGAILNEKYIEYAIYDENNNIQGDKTIVEINPTITGNYPLNIDVRNIYHGTYKLTIQLKGKKGSSNPASNILEHKILRQVQGQGILFDAYLPEQVQQYTDIKISYLLVSDSVLTYPLEIELNTMERPIIANIVANQLGEYIMVPINRQGVYTLTLRIPDLGIDTQYEFTVIKYSGLLPVIDTDRADLQFYLTAAGQDNSLVNRDKWESSTLQGVHIANLKKFYWGTINGWMRDEQNIPYLKISQGAELKADSYKPFNSDAMSGLGMTIELDFKLTGVTDFDAELIKCYSTNEYGTITGGFAITGNTAKFYHSSKNTDDTCIKFNLVENKRIKLTYRIEPRNLKDGFPLILAYINGICSKAEPYEATDELRDASANPAIFTVDSTHGEVHLYNVRFYNNAIDEAIILNNYQASLPTKEEREISYKSNAILDNNGNINLSLIEVEDYPLTIPYVKITGGFGCNSSFTMKKADSGDTFALPVGKKDYRLIDIDIIYPQTDYFAGYGRLDNNGEPTYRFSTRCKFTGDETVTTGYGLTPVSGGAIMYCQGTSSMEYPIKNLRIKWQDDAIRVRPDLPPVNLICFKADFMDSSGSHNTGAANLIDALYDGIEISTPGQEYFNDEKIITCIKGHPCLIFYSPSGEEGSYQFIGKYNLNLDKATPEPFGFKHDSNNTDLIPSNTLNEAQIKFGYLLDEEGNVVIENNKKVNAIHCYEFLDNKVKVCNFLPEDGMTYYNTWYQEYYNKDKQKNMPGWTKGFESRFPEDEVGANEADSLYELASWLNGLQSLREQEKANGSSETDITYEYEYILSTEIFNDSIEYYQKVNENYELIQLTEDSYEIGVYYTRSIKNYTFGMTSLERFKREYQTYFDKDFLLTYYVITEALHMMDSRVKNMMIATWGKELRNYMDLDGQEKTVYHWIWYPIFYDMDTMLGLDNYGKPIWKYDDDDTDPSAFSGDDVLWNFVRDVLFNEVNEYYDKLEQFGGLTANGIISRFNNNQSSMANEAMYNRDCYYKYISPFRTGYYNYLKEEYVEPGKMKYLYAAQGSRELDREYYIKNRILYLSGKHASTNYYNNSSNYITFRVNEPQISANDSEQEQEKVRLTLEAVPVSKTLDYSSLKTGYAGVLIGANGQLNNYRFEDEQTITVDCDTKGANNTEAYLLGVNILSDLGDLSHSYPEKFITGGAIDCRVTRLQLGNNHKYYYNKAWTGADALSFDSYSYLNEFEMSNCSEYKQPLNFEKNKVLQKLYLTGNGVTSVTLPTGGILQELRLPAMQSLYIQSHSLLTDDTFTFGYYDYEKENEVRPEKGNWVNDFSKLTKLQIIDTPINTYNIVCNAPQLDTYQLNGIEWIIDDTTLKNLYIYEGKANEIDRIDGQIYYCLNNDQTDYVEYQGNFEDNISLFILSTLITNGEILEIPQLEFLKNKNTINGISKADALTGTITINVTARANEFNLFQKYINIYPGVTLIYGDKVQLTEAYTIDFYNAEEYASGLIPYKSYLSNGNLTWAEITQDLVPPERIDNYYIYNFTGSWREVVEEGEGEIFNLNEQLNEKPPQRNLKLIPIFEREKRLWNVEFFDYDGSKINSLSTQLPYNELNAAGNVKSIKEHLSNKPLYFYYRDDSDLEENERYTLKGWKTKTDYDNNISNPVLLDLSTIYVQPKTLQFYAHYEIEDCTTTPSQQQIFDISQISTEDKRLQIKINSVYKDVLEGKITLPSKSYTSQKPIEVIAQGFLENQTKVNKIFFIPDSNYTQIANRAFAGCSNLSYLNLPNSLKAIGTGAFGSCSKLKIEDLPENLETIESTAFLGCSNLEIKEFGTINNAPNLQFIRELAFRNAGNNINEVVLGSSNENKLTIAETAFESYGVEGIMVTIEENVVGDQDKFGFEDPTITDKRG